MSRATRQYPGFVGNRSQAALETQGWLAGFLGETTAFAAERVAKRVHVFRLAGERGSGLLAESDEALPDRPGVWRTRTSLWIRPAGEPGSHVLELELHAFDLATEAQATGDDSALKVGRRLMYAERDGRTAAVADELDRGRAFELPPGAIPALLAGITPDGVRRLAKRHAPELLVDWDEPVAWAIRESEP